VRFRVSKRARRSIERINAWWFENRRAAPMLFLDELASAEVLLRSNPEAGTVYATHGSGVVRRIVLPKTRHHLYYRYVAERSELVVLVIWGAPRERGPKL